MKTKKITLAILMLAISLSLFAQLNPIRNLYWHHWYVQPYNFYELSWLQPLPSANDTLVGYKVYRNSTLYRFQTTIGAHHNFPQDTSFGGEGFVYGFPAPFYIHVTAVYNSNRLESGYTDSARCGGAMLYIEKKENVMVNISPNPVNENSIISISLPATKMELISIYSSNGILITKLPVSSSTMNVPVSDLKLKRGLYFLLLTGKDYSQLFKFIKTE